ncbi:hypothetical protein HT749_29015 [Burkholderia cepacia]|uniref:hypothetical protein n=1 Tax=Burkholderia cepacia TaxID=292 RepID=UPI00157A25A7|nr:hypothetical protein [Burkholderia cepacia]NTX47434.1 hypothetical protein [Burkholderia cepacia]
MAMTWRFSRQTRTGVAPAIRDQLVSVDLDVLCLRNPSVADSVFMGKMYISMTLAGVFVITYLVFFTGNVSADLLIGYSILMVFPAFVCILVWYRIFFVKRLSNWTYP